MTKKTTNSVYWAVDRDVGWAVDKAVSDAVDGVVDWAMDRAVRWAVYRTVYRAEDWAMHTDSEHPALQDFLRSCICGAGVA